MSCHAFSPSPFSSTPPIPYLSSFMPPIHFFSTTTYNINNTTTNHHTALRDCLTQQQSSEQKPHDSNLRNGCSIKFSLPPTQHLRPIRSLSWFNSSLQLQEDGRSEKSIANHRLRWRLVDYAWKPYPSSTSVSSSSGTSNGTSSMASIAGRKSYPSPRILATCCRCLPPAYPRSRISVFTGH
jgi:hypothetical protein